MAKRRLKVLQPSSDDGEPRPPAQWTIIGAAAILLAWLPLAYASNHWYEARVASLGTHEELVAAMMRMTPMGRLSYGLHLVLGPIVTLAIASLLGGMLVGRFGQKAGANEAMFAGIVVGTIGSIIGAVQMLPQGRYDSWGIAASVLLVVAGACGRIGGWYGMKKRGA